MPALLKCSDAGIELAILATKKIVFSMKIQPIYISHNHKLDLDIHDFDLLSNLKTTTKEQYLTIKDGIGKSKLLECTFFSTQTLKSEE